MSLETLIEEIVRRVVREEIAAALAKPAATEVTPADYASDHKLSLSTVRAAIREGRLPSKKYGRAVRIPAGAVIGPKPQAATTESRVERALSLVPRGGK